MTLCQLHRFHAPKALRVEHHHVIPQAWQRVWQPRYWPRPDDLWFSQTTPLCPTSHSNVHTLLVEIMKAYEQRRDLEDAHYFVKKTRGRTKEITVAMYAPQLWISEGGSLDHLVEMGQYGRGIAVPR